MKILTRPSLLIAAALAALAVGGAFLLDVAPTAPAPFAFQYRWPVGTEYVYGVAWRTEQHGLLPFKAPDGRSENSAEGSMDLDADVVVRVLDMQGGDTLLGVSFRDFRRHSLRVMGQDVLPTDGAVREQIGDAEAVLQVAPSGEVRALRFAPEHPDVFKHLTHWLFTEGQLVFPEDSVALASGHWARTESTINGRARMDYEARGLEVVRRWSHYERINQALTAQAPAHTARGEGRFVLDGAGHLLSLRQSETLAAPGSGSLSATGTLELTLRSVGPAGRTVAAPVMAALTEVRRPGEVTPSATVQRKLLEERIAGLTFEQLLADLEGMGGSPELPDHARWVWRAVGVLTREPERCKELGAVFLDPERGANSRALVLDLLAAAGSPEAQEVLRTLLDAPVAKQELREYVLLLQRVSLVERPTPETVAFAAEQYRRAAAAGDRPVELASAYALGATVGHLAQGDDVSAAAEPNQALLRGLDAARGPEEVSGHLRALGNAGLKENVPALLAHARDEEPSVQAAVAAGLRKTDTPEANTALVGLAAATHPRVQASALDALRTHAITVEDARALAAVVARGGLAPENAPLLVGLAEGLAPGDAIRTQLGQALSGLRTADPTLRGRIQRLLGSAG